MITKRGYADNSIVRKLAEGEAQASLASPEVVARLEKFANTVRHIAPKSEDFLYFTIVFMKAAESCLIDDQGNLKKVGNEKAWGYFDENWRWHGNIRPHKNSNQDIFPSDQLKIAAREWIGKSLCRDHKSDSVDGVIGIILDTYYDEKLKQIVGLCALDRINYPDLARKVETGIVRFGSMGTAVSTAICFDCGKKATCSEEFCDHMAHKTTYGEINVGLKPIEYSLVVQPAEPAARLLRCIASIKNHQDELKNYGVEVDELSKSLTVSQADDLDILLNSVCGKDGCSLEQRQRIIKGFLKTNGFMKTAAITAPDPSLTKSLAEFQNATGYTLREAPELYQKVFGDFVSDLPLPDRGSGLQSGETVGGQENAYHSENLVGKSEQDVSNLTGTGSSGLVSSVSEERPDTFQGDGVGPEHYAYAAEIDNKSIKTLSEEIMKEARRRQRAEQRRRLAYHQGGSEGVEPSGTYKDEGARQEKIRDTEDKQMLQDKSMGGADGMFPGDEQVKEKLSRAEEEVKGAKKQAYHQGGSEGVEPATFKSEDYHKYWEDDKQMHQDKSMGGADGMFPGDEKVKEVQKRAAYVGPALKTVFKQRRNLDGSINKSASCFEVYSGDKLVIAATAKDIFGSKLDEKWDWITSQDYGKAVVAKIRERGLDYVGKHLTKQAQEVPPAADPMASAPSAPGPDLGEAPPMEEGAEETDPKVTLEDALSTMETAVQDAKSALTELGGGETPEVGETAVETPELQLAANVVGNLKLVLADAEESADELAMLSETYDGYRKLSKQQKAQLQTLTQEALNDSASIVGETNTLVRMAKVIAKSMVKTSAQYVEEVPAQKVAAPVAKAPEVKPEAKSDSTAELVAAAMQLRKNRRSELLKKAEEEAAKEEKAEEKTNEADDSSVGQHENMPVAGVATEIAEQIAVKAPQGGEHKAAPHKGNQDAQQFSEYPSTDARTVAEKSNSAADGKTDEVAMESEAKDKDEPKPKTEETKEETKESEAQDVVQAKLGESFMKKKAEEEREAYKLKLRRAYDVAMDMQRKGLLAPTKPALDRQVDEIMDFDDKAFEAFKRSIAMAKETSLAKLASADLGGVNVGITEEEHEAAPKTSKRVDASSLSKLWE